MNPEGQDVRGPHITDEFRRTFRTWSDLTDHLTRVGVPERFHARVIRQLLMADFAMRVGEAMGSPVVSIGSGTTHMRQHGPWPPGVRFDAGSLPEAYAGARLANDKDVYFPGFRDVEELRERLGHAIIGSAGPGLGELVVYEVGKPAIDYDGHGVAMITASPVGAPGAEPVEFEFDAKSPRSQAPVETTVGYQSAMHPYVPVRFPGFHERGFLVAPPEFMLADMLILSTGPRRSGEGGLDGHWCRPKDLYVLNQLIGTGQVDGDLLKHALDNNYNNKSGTRFDLAGFDMRGRKGELIEFENGERRNGLEVWTSGADGIRARQQYLANHPTAGHMMADVVAFARGLARAGNGANWHDGAWHRADGSLVESKPVTVYNLRTAQGVWLTPAQTVTPDQVVSTARVTAHTLAAAKGMPRLPVERGVRNAPVARLDDTAPELVANRAAVGLGPGTTPACFAPWAMTRRSQEGLAKTAEHALG